MSTESAKLIEESHSNSSRGTMSPPLMIVAVCLLLLSFVFSCYRVVPLFVGSRVSVSGERLSQLTHTDWENAMRRLDVQQPEAALLYIQKSTGNDSLKSYRSILQGRLFLEGRKLFAAKQSFQEAVGVAKLNPTAFYWLGATHYALGDIASAEGYWLQSLEVNPKDVNTHRSLSMIYYDRGAIDHAVQHLREVAALAPDDARPHRLLGLIHKDYERYAEGAEFYRAALARKLSPETRQEVQTELAECLVKTRDYEESLSVIREAQPTPTTLVLKADCLVGMGKSDEAAEILDQLLTSLPDQVEALVVRASIHIEQQQPEAAVKLLERAVEQRPTDYLANFRLSQALRTVGETERASVVAKRAEELKLMRERFSQLHQDATARPLDAEVRYQLGELAMELEMPELAVTWLRVAIQLDPQHAQAAELLKRLTPLAQETDAASR